MHAITTAYITREVGRYLLWLILFDTPYFFS